jgi:hypothetical protein
MIIIKPTIHILHRSRTLSDQSIISDIERKRLSTVGSEQSTNPDSNHRSIERGTQPRLLSGVIRSLKYWIPIPADFARARDTQTTTLDTTEARERRLIERGIAIVVAAIVLIFLGATLTWPAMLLVTAIFFKIVYVAFLQVSQYLFLKQPYLKLI